MANPPPTPRSSELEIRKQLIESGAVDVIIAIGSNFFYTVTLPCTLWFFDKGRLALIGRTRSCSSMPGIYTGSWTGRIGILRGR